MFQKGDKVNTPQGKGTIAWSRMAPPDYTQVHIYSVILDNKKDQASYSGTIIRASEVSKAE